MQRHLFTVAAILECLAGAALILAPRLAVALLAGTEPEQVGVMVARLTGAALLALGLACWGAGSDAGGPARIGTLRAITLYNVGAGLLLGMWAAANGTRGLVAGAASILHLGLGLAFLVSHVANTRAPLKSR